MATLWVVWYPACFYHAYFFPLETQLGCLNYSFPGTFKTVASQTDHAGAPRYRKGFSRSPVFMSFFLLWKEKYHCEVLLGEAARPLISLMGE